MKIKKEFTVRDLYGEDVLVPVGETAKSFKGIIKMNNIGRFIWENLEKVETDNEETEAARAFDVDILPT